MANLDVSNQLKRALKRQKESEEEIRILQAQLNQSKSKKTRLEEDDAYSLCSLGEIGKSSIQDNNSDDDDDSTYATYSNGIIRNQPSTKDQLILQDDEFQYDSDLSKTARIDDSDVDAEQDDEQHDAFARKEVNRRKKQQPARLPIDRNVWSVGSIFDTPAHTDERHYLHGLASSESAKSYPEADLVRQFKKTKSVLGKYKFTCSIYTTTNYNYSTSDS